MQTKRCAGVSENEESDDRPPSWAGGVAVCPGPKLHNTKGLTQRSDRPEWDDWRWQMRNRIRTTAELAQVFPDLPVCLGMVAAGERFPLAITPYYASLIREPTESDPVYRMSVPDGAECFDPPHLGDDPLGEEDDMPVPGLVHRYPDRALVLTTSICSVYCRHCTRKRVTGQRERTTSAAELRRMKAYLAAHPEIHDVIVSGGDPFTMTTRSLERVLATVRSVPTVDVVRIGTRCPVVLPMRITDELVEMLRRYHPLYVNTQFNHPVELTPQAAEACLRLVDAGIPVGNQTVLLAGVNDDPQTLETLFRGLLKIRVRPYYLFQCDLVRGVEHFRTPLSRGIEIMEYLRGRLSGLAIPQFVVDAPHGGGKIPLLPNYILSMSPTHTVLRNFEGMMVTIPEPAGPRDSEPAAQQAASAGTGVWELACGRAQAIEPAQMQRRDRRNAQQGESRRQAGMR